LLVLMPFQMLLWVMVIRGKALKPLPISYELAIMLADQLLQSAALRVLQGPDETRK
jgi:hypothetical protein